MGLIWALGIKTQTPHLDEGDFQRDLPATSEQPNPPQQRAVTVRAPSGREPTALLPPPARAAPPPAARGIAHLAVHRVAVLADEAAHRHVAVFAALVDARLQLREVIEPPRQLRGPIAAAVAAECARRARGRKDGGVRVDLDMGGLTGWLTDSFSGRMGASSLLVTPPERSSSSLYMHAIHGVDLDVGC